MIKKIISGGNPGVEIAALDAAIRLDIPHAGWCYRDRKTDGGVLADHYNVKEIDNPSYFERLEKNIIDSEGTVVPMVSWLSAIKRLKTWLLITINPFWMSIEANALSITPYP